MSDQQAESGQTANVDPTAPVADQQADDRTSGEVANPEVEEANADRQVNVGSQGEQLPADATGVDQNRAIAQSAPPPSAQSGVPIDSEREAGVEPQPEFAGPVTGADQPEPPQTGEGAGTTHPASPAE